MRHRQPYDPVAHKKAREAWYRREELRELIRGLGRNDKCPIHEKKLKKCGCLKEANSRIDYNGKLF